MLKRIIKTVTVAATIACLAVCSFPVQAFAVEPVVFSEAEALGATIVDLYGAVNNTSLAYDNLSSSGALTEIITLYQEYSSDASDPYTLAVIGAAAAAAGTIAVVYDAITGQGYVQLYQSQYIESLDGFWDYTLSDLGFLRNNDGDFEWTIDSVTGDVNPVIVTQIPGTWGNQPIPITSNSNEAVAANGLYLGTQNASGSNPLPFYGASTSSSSIYVFCYPSGNGLARCFVSSLSGQTARYCYYYTNNPSNLFGSSITLNSTNASYPLYYGSSGSTGNFSSSVPVYASLVDGLQAVYDVINNGDLSAAAVFLEPSFYVGDPLTVVPTITVPDVAGDPNYAPQPIRINTGIEWNPDWGDPVPDGITPVPGTPYPVTDPSILNDAVPEIWQQVVEGTNVEVDPDPDPDPDPDNGGPNEVFTPILPVTLPSFNFSFSGIWHYVREWVSSLGAWFTTLFSIWAALPYAMVVPVYATAVVVIVLGVYKRFFM